MPIGVLFEFRGATSRAKYEKSVKMILKGRRTRLADWPAWLFNYWPGPTGSPILKNGLGLRRWQPVIDAWPNRHRTRPV